MKKTIIVLALAFMAILNHCDKSDRPSHTKTENESRQKITLCKKEAPVSFVLEKKIELTDIADPKISVSPYDNRVYVYGRSLRSKKPDMLIRIFNKNLEIVGEKDLKYGQGPGEVGPTNLLSLGKSEMYISVASNRSWNIYDNDFNFLRLERYAENIDGAFQLEKNGSFFIDSTRRKDAENRRFSSYTFRIINFPLMKNYKTIYKSGLFTNREEPGMTSQRVRMVFGKNSDLSFFYKAGYVYILFCDEYRLLKINLEGDVSNDLFVEFKQQYFDKQKEREYLREHGLANLKNVTLNKLVAPVSCLIPLEKGFVVTRRKDYHLNCSSEIEGDYFSYTLDSIGTVKVPCFYNAGEMKLGLIWNRYMYEANMFYLVKEENELLFVEKWRVKE